MDISLVFSWIIVNTLAVFYGSLVSLKMLIEFLLNRGTWVIKKRDTPPTCLTDSSLGEHCYAQLKDVKIHYVEKGNKKQPLMLFVHGFPEFWYSWRHQLKEFSREYWVVAMDMRGYGESDKPADLEAYKSDLLVEDIKDLIKELGREKCILVAHDWGGALAWMFVQKYPEMLERYIIMDAPYPEVYRNLLFSNLKQFIKSWYIFFFQLPVLPELFIQENDYSAFDSMMRQGKERTRILDQDLEAYKYTFGKKGALTPPLNYYRAAKFIASPQRRLPSKLSIEAPGLFIYGELDNYLQPENLMETIKFVDNLSIEIVRNANHFVQQDSPEAVNELIWKFVKS